MWMATAYGFFSIVKKAEIDKQHPYQVRARSPWDLRCLQDRFRWLRKRPIIHTEAADYPARLCLNRRQWMRLQIALAADLDYSNFKSMISSKPAQRDKGDAYHRIWSIMGDYQEQATGKGPYGLPKRPRWPDTGPFADEAGYQAEMEGLALPAGEQAAEACDLCFEPLVNGREELTYCHPETGDEEVLIVCPLCAAHYRATNGEPAPF